MGKLLVLGGPSCSGKTSIKKKIISMFPIKFKPLVTATTREPRKNEKHREDYYFFSKDEFNWKIYQNDFLEHTEYAGHRYGVLKEIVDDIKKNHHFTLAVMDLNGLKSMVDYLGKENVVSFYIDVSEQTIADRLRKRGSTKEEIRERIEKALNEEMKYEYKDNFDFIIQNETQSIESVVFQIVDILTKKQYQ